MVTPKSKEEEFNFYLRFAKPLVLNLPDTKDRIKAAAWVRKLRSNDTDVPLRVDYLKLLLFSLQRRKLIGPFAQVPDESKPLAQFPHETNLQNIAKYFTEMDRKAFKDILKKGGYGEWPPYTVACTSDFRQYAASQAIPNFGTHVYFAISPDPLQSWKHFQAAIPPAGETIDASQPEWKVGEISPDISCFQTDKSRVPSRRPDEKKEEAKIHDELEMDRRIPPSWGSNLISVEDRLSKRIAAPLDTESATAQSLISRLEYEGKFTMEDMMEAAVGDLLFEEQLPEDELDELVDISMDEVPEEEAAKPFHRDEMQHLQKYIKDELKLIAAKVPATTPGRSTTPFRIEDLERELEAKVEELYEEEPAEEVHIMDQSIPEGLPPGLLPPSWWTYKSPPEYKTKPFQRTQLKSPRDIIYSEAPIPVDLRYEMPPEGFYSPTSTTSMSPIPSERDYAQILSEFTVGDLEAEEQIEFYKSPESTPEYLRIIRRQEEDIGYRPAAPKTVEEFEQAQQADAELMNIFTKQTSKLPVKQRYVLKPKPEPKPRQPIEDRSLAEAKAWREKLKRDLLMHDKVKYEETEKYVPGLETIEEQQLEEIPTGLTTTEMLKRTGMVRESPYVPYSTAASPIKSPDRERVEFGWKSPTELKTTPFKRTELRVPEVRTPERITEFVYEDQSQEPITHPMFHEVAPYVYEPGQYEGILDRRAPVFLEAHFEVRPEQLTDEEWHALYEEQAASRARLYTAETIITADLIKEALLYTHPTWSPPKTFESPTTPPGAQPIDLSWSTPPGLRTTRPTRTPLKTPVAKSPIKVSYTLADVGLPEDEPEGPVTHPMFRKPEPIERKPVHFEDILKKGDRMIRKPQIVETPPRLYMPRPIIDSPPTPESTRITFRQRVMSHTIRKGSPIEESSVEESSIEEEGLETITEEPLEESPLRPTAAEMFRRTGILPEVPYVPYTVETSPVTSPERKPVDFEWTTPPEMRTTRPTRTPLKTPVVKSPIKVSYTLVDTGIPEDEPGGPITHPMFEPGPQPHEPKARTYGDILQRRGDALPQMKVIRDPELTEEEWEARYQQEASERRRRAEKRHRRMRERLEQVHRSPFALTPQTYAHLEREPRIRPFVPEREPVSAPVPVPRPVPAPAPVPPCGPECPAKSMTPEEIALQRIREQEKLLGYEVGTEKTLSEKVKAETRKKVPVPVRKAKYREERPPVVVGSPESLESLRRRIKGHKPFRYRRYCPGASVAPILETIEEYPQAEYISPTRARGPYPIADFGWVSPPTITEYQLPTRGTPLLEEERYPDFVQSPDSPTTTRGSPPREEQYIDYVQLPEFSGRMEGLQEEDIPDLASPERGHHPIYHEVLPHVRRERIDLPTVQADVEIIESPRFEHTPVLSDEDWQRRFEQESEMRRQRIAGREQEMQREVAQGYQSPTTSPEAYEVASPSPRQDWTWTTPQKYKYEKRPRTVLKSTKDIKTPPKRVLFPKDRSPSCSPKCPGKSPPRS